MLTNFFIGFLVILMLFCAVVAMQPSEFHYNRSTVMLAPAATIFPYVNDAKKMHEWSPWVQMEPDAEFSFEGPQAGVGAIAKWSGRKLGTGSSTITESVPDSHVTYRLDFLKPLKATNTAVITLKEDGGQTRVTWEMSGKSNFIGKAMNLIFDCEQMVGEQFSRGLAMLKGKVEA